MQLIDEKIKVLLCRGSLVLENNSQSLQAVRIPESAGALSERLSASCTPTRGQRKRSAPSDAATIVERSPDVSVSTE